MSATEAIFTARPSARPIISDAISFCNVCVWGGGAVDNNSYEWLLKSKNESE